MEWLTQLFETIRSYPWESLGATVGTVFVGFGGWRGLTALYDAVFSKTKKTIAKINNNVNERLQETNEALNSRINDLKDTVATLQAENKELLKAVKELPKNISLDEITAYITAITSQSADLSLTYQQELEKVKENSKALIADLNNETEKPNNEPIETETQQEPAQEPAKRRVKVKRK